MLRTKKAKRLLTKKEQQHLTKWGITSMAKMRCQVNTMLCQPKYTPIYVCWTCWKIARKLDLITDEMLEKG